MDQNFPSGARVMEDAELIWSQLGIFSGREDFPALISASQAVLPPTYCALLTARLGQLCLGLF